MAKNIQTNDTYAQGNIGIAGPTLTPIPVLLGATGQSTTAGMTQKAISDALAATSGATYTAGANIRFDPAGGSAYQIVGTDNSVVLRYSTTQSEWIGYSSLELGIAAMSANETLVLNKPIVSLPNATTLAGKNISGNNYEIVMSNTLNLSGTLTISNVSFTTTNASTINHTAQATVKFVNCKFGVNFSTGSSFASNFTFSNCSFVPGSTIAVTGNTVTWADNTDTTNVAVSAGTVVDNRPLKYRVEASARLSVFLTDRSTAVPFAANSVAIGAGAGNALTSGANHVLLGYNAGNKITTGTNDILIGYTAGSKITSSSNNIFVGTQAGMNVTTGAQSVAIGSNALQTGGNVSDNVAVGYNSMLLATVGQSTAVGSGSLAALTTGSGNVGIGYSGGFKITSGTNNVAIGHTTGGSIGGGSHNVAVGYKALGVNGGTSVQLNTAIGAYAGYSLVNGSNNVVMGYNAGGALTTETDNTFIGFQAGYNSAGSRNIVIGSSSSTGTGVNDSIAIGNNLTATVSNTIVLGDGSHKVGIGTANPTSKLHVIGDIEASIGLILKSPNGTRYKITVADGGALTTVAI